MKTLQRAIRTLLHYKQYSIINIVGLALSLACVIIIFRYVHGELTVDRFNRHLDRVFVTTMEAEAFVGLSISGMNIAQQADVDNVTRHPGVERVSNTSRRRDAIIVNDREFNAVIVAADTNFLKIMDFPIVAGIADFENPASAMVTQAFAQRVFGTRHAIGSTFRTSNDDLITVTGVIGETSTKASYTFDVIVSRELSAFRGGRGDTFVLLYRGVDYRAINRLYEAFVPLGGGGGGGAMGGRGGFGRTNVRFQLFPLANVYFSEISGPAFQRGNRQSVNILMLIGFVILLVGVVNYINIHTVVMMRKGKQLAVKKIFGAGSGSIFIQMLIDNALMIGIALAIGFVAVLVTGPFVANDLHLGQVPNLSFDIWLSLGILAFLSIITTLYPFYRYRFHTPIHSLRGLDKIRGGRMRNVFLTIQYFMTITMIIVSMFFVKQVHFMLNFDVGFRTENVITLRNFMRWQGGAQLGGWQQARGGGGGADRRVADEIGQRLDASPLFLSWTPGEAPQAMGEIELSYLDGEPREVRFMSGRQDWFDVFDIRLVEGRMWDDHLDAGQPHILVTESFLPYFGITDWRTASIQPDLGEGLSAFVPSLQIIGIVRNFTHTHLSEPTLPVIFGNLGAGGGRGGGSSISAAIVPGRTQDAVAFLRQLHQEVVGGEFTYTFVDDQVRAMYAEERAIAVIYSIITLIAIIISALGLYGMSLFDIQQRRREIAIRKVHGATIVDVIRLLMRKYLISLGVAFVVATPVAVFAINRYLEDYAHRATIAWWLFAGALVITASISFFTLLYQTYKAANMNPAMVVKSE